MNFNRTGDGMKEGTVEKLALQLTIEVIFGNVEAEFEF